MILEHKESFFLWFMSWFIEVHWKVKVDHTARHLVMLPVRHGQQLQRRPSLCFCVHGSVHSRSCQCRKWLSSPFLGWQLQARRLGLCAWSGCLQDNKNKPSVTQRETILWFRREEVYILYILYFLLFTFTFINSHLTACHRSWTWPQGGATVTWE